MAVNQQVGAYDGQSASWSLLRSINKLEGLKRSINKLKGLKQSIGKLELMAVNSR